MEIYNGMAVFLYYFSMKSIPWFHSVHSCFSTGTCAMTKIG